MWSVKGHARRAEIRKNRPEAPRLNWEKWRAEGVGTSLAIAGLFFVVASTILMWRQDVVTFRPGMWIPHDIVSRVQFTYRDQNLLAQYQREARDREPRVYKPGDDVWGDLQKALLALPERLATGSRQELPSDLRTVFEPGDVTLLRQYLPDKEHERYVQLVSNYVSEIRNYRLTVGGRPWPLVILPASERMDELKRRQPIRVEGFGLIDPIRTYSLKSDELAATLNKLADHWFGLSLQHKIVEYTLNTLQPNYVLDMTATTSAQNVAEARVPLTAGDVLFYKDQPFITPDVNHRTFTQQDWQLLKAENAKYIHTLKGFLWKSKVGTAGIVLVITIVMAAYVSMYQPKIIKNHARAFGIVALLLSMLLLNQIAALGNGPIYLFGIAPTILVAMILTVAYEPRFAVGLASMHGMLATLALGQGMTFFMILWAGVLTTCFLLDDIRTRSKLIEIGGATAIAMMIAAAATGAMGFDPWPFVLQNALYAGAAGLTVGFVLLGILPFIEKAFRITTSMTLLELADASHPLLRRLAIEAPGTYNHSLQVAALAEAAAEAIGANSLLCRVASYYHDVGKINKADYFVENQGGGENRHLNLSPSVSLLIIIGHVKDGVELAREYNLPNSVVPFIQQHHGTTLVEYFYHQACKKEQLNPDPCGVSETQYRYPGPKPRTREVAIVMIADAAESACRAMPEPTASRVEALVHDLTMKRLLDGQFDECDLTMRELELIERSIMKALLGIYHGRVQYPSTAALMNATPAVVPPTTVKSAG